MFQFREEVAGEEIRHINWCGWIQVQQNQGFHPIEPGLPTFGSQRGEYGLDNSCTFDHEMNPSDGIPVRTVPEYVEQGIGDKLIIVALKGKPQYEVKWGSF